MDKEPTPTDFAEGLTAEAIKEHTGFELQAIYPGFDEEDGYVSPQVHEDRENLAGHLGEDNVLTSFYCEDGKVRLGLFLRKP